jgi:nucleotide-binding universal stress UspA family protein
MPAIDIQSEVVLHHITLATDFSPIAGIAAGYAAGLARRFGATLQLTNVLDLSLTVPAGEVLMEPALESVRRTGRESLHHLASQIPGVKTTRKLAEGFLPAPLILEAATESAADLIVLGTSSKHGLKKFFLGSTAEEVIRTATCPVLTVGPHAAKPAPGPLGFKRIVYVTDFSPQAEKALQHALSFAVDGHSYLYLCHVVSDKEAATRSAPHAFSLTRLGKLIPESLDVRCTPECIVEHGTAAEEIIRLAARVRADLIVLGARKSTFWLTHIETGLTPALLAAIKCPTLTVSS